MPDAYLVVALRNLRTRDVGTGVPVAQQGPNRREEFP